MNDFEIKEITGCQIYDTNTLEPIVKFDGVGAVSLESELETNSLSKEVLSFTREASFECKLTDDSPLLDHMSGSSDKLCYTMFNIPIMVQARWHKKPRVNKKWLKRYGMKKDSIVATCDVVVINPNIDHDNGCLTKHMEYSMTVDNVQYDIRPDLMRKNLEVVM